MNRRLRRESTNVVGTGSGSTTQSSSRPRYRSSRSRRQRLAAGAVLATTGLLGTYLAALRPQPTYAAPVRGASGQSSLQPRIAIPDIPTCGDADTFVSTEPDLRNAILASQDDSIICVAAPITLTGDLPTIDDTTITFVGDPNLGSAISGDDSYTIFRADFSADLSASDDDTLTVAYLTLSRGYFASNNADQSYGGGGAVRVYSSESSPTYQDALVLFDTDIMDSKAYDPSRFRYRSGGGVFSSVPVAIAFSSLDRNAGSLGGAVYAVSGGEINDSSFTYNYATDDGGAVRAGGELRVSGTPFYRNDAGGKGGAVSMDDTYGLLVVRFSDFTENSAVHGGAIEMSPGYGQYAYPFLDVRNSHFDGNVTSGNGGAIYLYRADEASIRTSTFTGNIAGTPGPPPSAHEGGAIYSTYSLVDIRDTRFSANQASGRGGAVSSRYRGIFITRSYFEANTAVFSGGALDVWSNPSVDVSLATFSGNLVDSTGTDDYARGGAISSGDSLVAIARASFLDNRAIGDDTGVGGAMAISSQSYVDLENSFLGGNYATNSGGGIYVNASVLDLVFSASYDDSAGGAGRAASLYSRGGVLTAGGTVIGSSTDDTVIELDQNSSMDDSYSVSTGPAVFNGLGSENVPKGTLELGSVDDTDTGPGRGGRSPASTSVLVTEAPLAGVVYLFLEEDQLGDPRPSPITDPGSQWTIGARQVAGLQAALVPTFDTPVSTADGFTVNVTNWDGSWTWNPSASAGSVVAGAGSGSMLPLTVSGLTPGQSSMVSVTSDRTGYVQGSANVTGQATSASPSPTPSPLPPSAPTAVAAVPGNGSAMVSWSPPSSSGSFPITSYRVTASPGGQTCLTSGTSCTVDGLTNGTTYTFDVAALNGAGWGVSASSGPVTPSATPGPSPQPLPGPVPPGGSVLTVDGVPDPDLSVDPNATDNGLDVTGDGWSMTLDGLGPDGRPLQLGPNETLILDAERQVRSTGTGFLPGSQVDVYMDPPVLLQTGTTGSWLRDVLLRAVEATKIGSFAVAADGTFSGDATLPEEIMAGEHVLQAVGFSPTRQTRAVSLGVLVRPWIELDKGPRTADGRHDRVRATGESGGLDAGVRLAPFIRYSGQTDFKQGVASITLQSDGTFTWTRQVKKSKGLAAYVAYTDVTSNRVYWTQIR